LLERDTRPKGEKRLGLTKPVIIVLLFYSTE